VHVLETGERMMIDEIERRLASKYAQLPPDRVAAAIRNAHSQFERSKIRDFVPLLVERLARAELSKAATSPAVDLAV
jgi:hypothetical protein